MYVAQTGLTRRLAVDLLDKMNNPDNHQHYSEVDDDDLEVMPDAYTSKNSTVEKNGKFTFARRTLKVYTTYKEMIKDKIRQKEPFF